MVMPKRVIMVSGGEINLDTAAETYQLRKTLITQRLSNGWTPEEAVGVEPSPKAKATQANDRARGAQKTRTEKHFVCYEGESVRLGVLCKKLDIGVGAVRRQLDKGASLGDAIIYVTKCRVGLKKKREYWQLLDKHYRDQALEG